MHFFGVWVLALAAAGCLPKIGDPCGSSINCSARGERLCDNTQPGGYCTIFSCEPDTCPDSSSCVAFNHEVDPACGDSNDGTYPRFQRTFCVAPCNEKADCRAGYDCVDVASRGGLVVDQDSPRPKACLVELAQSGGNGTESPPPVCEPGQPGPLPEPYEPEVSTGGSGGGM
jgi:hypothetical protein